MEGSRSPRLEVVPHGGAAWQECVQLRLEVLRRPLGLTFAPEALAAESADLHLAAYQGEALLGCLVLSRVDAETVRMRQVAIHPDRQRGGLGTLLVAESEVQARRLGYRTMTLHARQTAVAYYERLGYRAVGEPFVEVTIPHRTMEKRLVE
jgi:N-acetylglutamate synthase-like GNAT family acetyltransferase